MRLAQVLADYAGDFLRMGDDFIQRPILNQPFHCGLRADFLDPGHVVHAVADQGEIVHHLRGFNPELALDPRFIEIFAGHGIDQLHHRVDELRNVLVAGGNDGQNAERFGLFRQRTDDIVGFHAFNHQQRPAQRADAIVQRFDLLDQILRHRRPIGFVLRIPIVAKGLSFCVEYAGYIIRRCLLAQLLQHAEHALDGAGWFAVPVTQVRQCMEGAVQVRRPINQNQCFHRRSVRKIQAEDSRI